MQFAFPGWLRESTSQCCPHRPGSQPGGLMGVTCLCTTSFHSGSCWTLPVCPTHSTNPFPFCSFPTTCTLCRDHHNIQLKETPRDTHDSREPSHVFLKYMTLDIRFCFSSPFAIPSLKCITICAFSSEYQACKLLLQGKKSLKEVTPQRTGSAHCLRGSYYIEYPWEMKCSHQFPTFFGIKVALWVRWSGKRIHWKKKRSMFFVPHLCLCQPELLSILWGSNRATLARKVDCYIQHLGLFTLTEALSFGWLFFFPWTMLK